MHQVRQVAIAIAIRLEICLAGQHFLEKHVRTQTHFLWINFPIANINTHMYIL